MPSFFSFSRFFLYLVPFASAIVTRTTLFPFIVGKYAWFRGSVAIALILFLFGLLFGEEAEEYEKKIIHAIRSPLGIAVGVFTIVFLLASIFGIKPNHSFWSNFERGEGGIQILHLYVFFILLTTLFKEPREWRKFFLCSAVSAMLMIFYGLGAGLGYNGFVGSRFGQEGGYRFEGAIGNPAYTAAYLIFAAFYALYLIVSKYSKKQIVTNLGAIVLLVMIGTYGVFFLLAATRGALLGLGAGLLVGLAYFGYSVKRWRRWVIGIGLTFVIALVFLISFRDTELVKKIPGSRIFDISFSAKTFQHRTIMWSVAWKSFLERPILGWGPESFGFLFQKNFNPAYFDPTQAFGSWFDRAHNVIFDYLAETGILGLLSYLSIFLVTFIHLLKKQNMVKRPGKTALMLGIPIAYLVQGLVLFDVLIIYINLYTFFAFTNYYREAEK